MMRSARLSSFVPVVGLAFACIVGCGSDRGNPLVNKLPTNADVPGWWMSGPDYVLTSKSTLAASVDGGAGQKLVDQGWVASIYASYAPRSIYLNYSVSVALYDMGKSENADAAYQDDKPASADAIPDTQNGSVSQVAVLEPPDPTTPPKSLRSYIGSATTGKYFIKVISSSIETTEGDSSTQGDLDAVRATVMDFVKAMIRRAEAN